MVVRFAARRSRPIRLGLVPRRRPIPPRAQPDIAGTGQSRAVFIAGAGCGRAPGQSAVSAHPGQIRAQPATLPGQRTAADRLARSQGRGGGGESGEGHVSGQHEPRDPHADERHHRAGSSAAPGARHAQAAGTTAQDRGSRATPAADSERHFGPVENRGRPADPGGNRILAGAGRRSRHQPAGGAGGGQGAGPDPERRRRGAGPAARRSAAIGANSAEFRRQRHQVFRARPDRHSRPAGRRGRGERIAAPRSGRPGHRSDRRATGAAVPALRPGRRLHHPPIRRHRPRTGDQPAFGAADGGRCGRSQRTRRR